MKACVLLLLAVATAASGQEQPHLSCEMGPLNRDFGDAPWLVYACDDGETLVVAATPENPAFEFYFVVYPQDGGYQVYGEGVGDRTVSDAAGDELSAMDPAALAAMHRDASALGDE